MAAKKKTYKFATLKKEAAKKAADRPKAKLPDPFVLDDVQPPIVITAPDTVERQLVIAECIGRDGNFDMANVMPLLRALCGDQFGRVWFLVKNDTEPDTLIALCQTMVDHFAEQGGLTADMVEAAELPGGSTGSSD